MKWITREHPKIDRIACPWLIRRFVDKDAEIMYVPFDQVVERSRVLNAIPFDLPDVEYTHYGDIPGTLRLLRIFPIQLEVSQTKQ